MQVASPKAFIKGIGGVNNSLKPEIILKNTKKIMINIT